MRRSTAATCAIALALAWGGAVAVETGSLNWHDPDLELYLEGVTEIEGRAQLQFALRLKPGREAAAVWVGYPRYRTGMARWNDAIVRGIVRRDRTLVASAATGGRQEFAVVVPLNADELLLELGDRELLLDLGADALRVRSDEPELWIVEDEWSAAPTPEAPGPLPGLPARLAASLRWEGLKPFGDGALDAGESGTLLVDIVNEGERSVRGVSVFVKADPPAGLDLPAVVTVPEIEPRASHTARVPVAASPDVAEGQVRLTVRVVEPHGHDAAPIEIELPLRARDPAKLVLLEDFALEGENLPVVRDRVVTLRLRVRNIGSGVAGQVAARVVPGEGVFTAHESPDRFELGALAPGEVGELVYRGYANQRAERFVLDLELSDALSGDRPASSRLELPLEEALAAVPRIVRVVPDPRESMAFEPAPPPLVSDVDRHVPLTPASRADAVAVALGVERYAAVPEATYAAADARTAARYFEHAMGIPAERVELLLDDDVTLASMNRLFDRDGWLARRIEEDSEVFVFFAGHGVAESERFDPYLVPHDGDLGYVRQTAMSLDALVGRLAALDAARVTLFLDACFSGLTRDGAALEPGTRKLVVVPVSRTPSGLSVFSAARGSQTAHALHEQGHGLFSYYLFRGLGGAADLDADRIVTSGELKLYVEDEVARVALVADLEQTPAIFPEDAGRVLVRLP